MAVLNQTPLDEYVGDGVTTDFTYTFHIYFDTQISVFLGGSLTAEDPADYTVSGVGNQAGGTITFDTAPGNGVAVRVERITTIENTVDWLSGGEIDSDTLDKVGDILTMICQEIDRRAFQEQADGTLNAGNRRLAACRA